MPTSKLSGAFDYSQLKQNWMGEWNPGVVYTLNDTVRLNGKAYVCTSTYFKDNGLYGTETKPGVDTSGNWSLVISGSIYKGDWSYKDRHYVGDIVRYNSDFYQCTADNYGGHPLYENGAVTTKWTLIAKSSRADRTKNKLWFKNYPPMGWTRNLCETSQQHGSPGYCSADTINGNYETNMVGRKYSGYRHGLGEYSGDWRVYSNPYPGGAWFHGKKQGFDFWDYQDGYRPTITGEEPRVVQWVGSENHDMVLFDNGEVYKAGYNGHGSNGDATTSDRAYFVRVGRSAGAGRGTGVLRDKHIIKIGTSDKSGGGSDENLDTHSCFALSNNGEVFTWGYNGYGQLGHGNTSNYSTVTQIPQGYFHNKKIVDMWMTGGNYQSSFALSADGDLYAWGYGGDGNLGTSAFQNHYRPERVKYNWKQFGGIKKILFRGHAAESVTIVLTNDGQLHGTGNINDGSYPIFGAASNGDTYVPRFTPLARLFEAKAGSLGYGSATHKEVGSVIDVTRNVEDFWIFGDGGMAHTIIIKEKTTGLMYGWGYNGHSQLSPFRKAINFDEYSSDNPYGWPNLAFPTLLNMGNMTDIKYIQNCLQGAAACYMYQNSDGRLWTNGSGGYHIRGIGSLGWNPSSALRRTQKLPWETWFTDQSPTQVRFAEKANIISSTNEGTGAPGCLIITTNNRFVVLNHGWSWHYSWDPTVEGTYGFNNSTPTRVDF